MFDATKLNEQEFDEYCSFMAGELTREVEQMREWMSHYPQWRYLWSRHYSYALSTKIRGIVHEG